jgi:hypothetical protein
MKLQDKERKHPPFDVAAGLAEALLTQGYVKISHRLHDLARRPKLH